jgi:hypothetical protein
MPPKPKRKVKARVMYAYYRNANESSFVVSSDFVMAEQEAGGFIWDNPRVRKVLVMEIGGVPVSEYLGAIAFAKTCVGKEHGDGAAMALMRLEQLETAIGIKKP